MSLLHSHTFARLSLFLVLLFPVISSASTTSGTIDSTNRYAWSENTGWIDFGSTAGAVAVTDASLSGYAYGENVGWIHLDSVANTAEGDLSGYAWAENVGWIDFGNVSINSSGQFTGSAYGENIGFLNFDVDSGVVTDWRPVSARATPTHSSSGRRRASGGGGVTSVPSVSVPTTAPSFGTPATLPTSFTSGRDITLSTTGEDVRALQIYLNTHGYPLALSGVGSSGNETAYFGLLTRTALARFQAANGITPSVGYFGPKTKAFIAALLSRNP